MDRGARIFWAIVVVLTAASLYFGVRAESVRRSVQHAAAAVQTGDLVSFKQILDADTVLLVNGEGDAVTVRIIGIKSFDTATRDVTGNIARQANDAMKRALEGKAIRLMLGTPTKDKHGRTLATLFVDDQDVAEKMIGEGLVLVYTAFPFPAMTEYLHEQDKARVAKKGLWGDPIAVERAGALMSEWRKGAPRSSRSFARSRAAWCATHRARSASRCCSSRSSPTARRAFSTSSFPPSPICRGPMRCGGRS